MNRELENVLIQVDGEIDRLVEHADTAIDKLRRQGEHAVADGLEEVRDQLFLMKVNTNA